MKPNIIIPAISECVAEVREQIDALHEAEAASVRLERDLEAARQAAQIRRMEIGRSLLKARATLPKRGTVEQGWGAFLEAVELDPATAWRYMELAKATVGLSPEKDRIPSLTDLGIVRRDGAEQPAGPPPRDEDAPREADAGATPASEEDEIDRDTWCTPKWITDALGKVDLDPCANERSHVNAKVAFDLARRGEDGLVKASTIGTSWTVFVNPPYSDVGPWIRAYAHTRFIFLLKFDPSTKWFEELIAKCELVLVPRRTRVQFEPPPGIPADKSKANPFPHALFFARAEDATSDLLDRHYRWRVE